MWRTATGGILATPTFKALRDIGYMGAVALESFQYPDMETAARRSLEFIQPFCRK